MQVVAPKALLVNLFPAVIQAAPGGDRSAEAQCDPRDPRRQPGLRAAGQTSCSSVSLREACNASRP